MSEKTLDDMASRDDPTRLFDESLVLLAGVQSVLARLLREIESGHLDRLGDLEARYLELEVALKRTYEMERLVHDWNRTHRSRGTARDATDIDFDRARHEIGCRLARLRACCNAD